MIVYLAGPYSADKEHTINEHIVVARNVATFLWELGYAVICPHLNTAHFEDDCRCTYDDYIRGDKEIIQRVDALVLLPDWRESAGTQEEVEWAYQRRIPIYDWPILPEKSTSEIRCPEQTRAFIDVVMGLFRLHQKKQADYGPGNISITGEVGLITRLSDKVMRLLNLYGWRFDIINTSFDLPSSPLNESIEDSFNDAANYAIIGKILKAGKWGK